MPWYAWFVAGWIVGWVALVGGLATLMMWRDWRAKANDRWQIRTSSRAQYERERARERVSS